jgi:YggT family protein
MGGLLCFSLHHSIAKVNPRAGNDVTPHGIVAREVAQRAALAYLLRNDGKRFAMPMIYDALTMILQVVWFVMIAHIVMSWLINFQVLNLRQPLVAQLWYGLTQLLAPLYRPIRRILPNTGALDLAPLVVFIIIIVLQRQLERSAGFFYGY